MTKKSLALAAWITLWSASVMAQTDIAIELPQQPLSKALSALARQTGTDIIAPEGLVSDRTAPAIKGRMTVREALGRLLRGMALDVDQRDDKTYVIILPKSTASLPATSSGATAVLPPIVVTNPADSDTEGFTVESTTSATKTDEPLIEIPQSIQVVNQKVIQSQQAQSVAEILRNVSGVQMGDGSEGGSTPGPMINGFLAGVTLNGGLSPGGGAHVLTLPMAAISRVEVLKGADAILSGAGNPGGTVNIVTKIPESTPRRELTVQTGSYGNILSSIDLTGPVTSDKRLSYRFIVSGERADRSFSDFDGKHDFYVSPSLRWKYGGTDIVVAFDQHLLHSPYRVYGIIAPDGGFYSASQNQRAHSTINVTGASYDWKQAIGRYLTFHSSARYKTTSSGSTPAAFVESVLGNDAVYMWMNGSNNHGHSISLDNNIDFHFTTGPVKHELMAGSAYSVYGNGGSEMSSGVVIAPFPTDTELVPSRIYTSKSRGSKDYYSSLYFQEKMSWNGLHFLMNWTHGQAWSTARPISAGKWNPNFGVAYQISDDWTIFANEQHSFSPHLGSFLVGGVPVPPTQKQSIEAGVKFELLDKRLSGTVSVHRSRSQNDLGSSVPGGNYATVVPNGRISRGVSIDLTGEIIRGLNIISNYSYNAYTENEQDAAHGYFFQAAKNSGSIWVTYDFQNAALHGWGLGAGIWARGSYPAYAINGGTISSIISVPGQAWMNGSIYYRSKHWFGTLGFKNIFNRRLYSDGGGGKFLGIDPGRTFYLTGTFDF